VHPTRIGRLRAIPLFAALDERALALIAATATEFDASAGHVLVERAQAGAGMFVLRREP
jgi:CRP-like cAMP-binding protein